MIDQLSGLKVNELPDHELLTVFPEVQRILGQMTVAMWKRYSFMHKTLAAEVPEQVVLADSVEAVTEKLLEVIDASGLVDNMPLVQSLASQVWAMELIGNLMQYKMINTLNPSVGSDIFGLSRIKASVLHLSRRLGIYPVPSLDVNGTNVEHNEKVVRALIAISSISRDEV